MTEVSTEKALTTALAVANDHGYRIKVTLAEKPGKRTPPSLQEAVRRRHGAQRRFGLLQLQQ